MLEQDVDRKFLEPLRTHGWSISSVRSIPEGEYLLIEVERGGHHHKIAVLKSSATANPVYRRLATEVEHIFVNGQLWQLASYAYGIDKPVSTADDFQQVLIGWNSASADGKFAPGPQISIDAKPPKDRRLLAEAPIEAIWLRLRQLASVTLARKLVEARAREAKIALDADALNTKAQGMAFSLRNAIDYFNVRDGQNVSQRVLNLYYGSMSFAFAEMLAAPSGPGALSQIEESTKQGHGLGTVDGEKEGLEHIVVNAIATGFFPTWIKFLGLPTDAFPRQKPKVYGDLSKQAATTWVTIEQLFARIPEVADLFTDIFESKPAWVTVAYDQSANKMPSLHGNREQPNTTYALLVDDSARLMRDDIAEFAEAISEITEVAAEGGGRHFRVAVNHAGKKIWWEALSLHDSPFERRAMIRPLFEVVGEYRAICVVLLYALSIVVRYRPSVWRRVQEGDLDHMRVLIEAFLAVVERVLPEQFLEAITGQRVFVKQPGAFF
ncbi:MAG: hypothetical protein ABSF69_17785 [Polyangiaceae bacterium]